MRQLRNASAVTLGLAFERGGDANNFALGHSLEF